MPPPRTVASVPPPHVDWGPPVGPPPTARRIPPRWLPAVVIGLCLALLAVGLYRADRIGISAAEVVDRFVPADGAVTQLETTVTPPAGVEPTRGTSVVESARRVGPEALLSLDFTLGTEVIGSVGAEQVQRVPFWRTTSTPVGNGAGQIEAIGQTTVVYDLTRAVELVAESGPEATRTYTPALVALPATVADLDLDQVDGTMINWDGAGNVAADRTYAYAFSGRVHSPGCVQVSGEITYAGTDGSDTVTRTIAQSWCTGRGVVAVEDREDGREYSARETGAPQVAVDPTPAPADWGDPREWRPTDVTARSVEPHLGEGIIAGSPGSLLPVWTPAGVLVRVSSAQDLVGLVPVTGGAAVQSRWRAHPGGTVVSLTGFGDLLIAATSERTVVGYAATGVRLWTTELPDVAFSAPTVVDDLVLITTLSGDVHALDRRTGTIRWHTALRSDIAPQTAVVADADRVVVMTRAGDLVALATKGGEELWRTEVDEGVLTALVDDQVMVADQRALWGLSAADGSTRWRARTDGTPHALQVDGARILVWAQQELISVGTDGDRHWVRPATAAAVLVGDSVVVMHGDQLQAVDASGATVASTEIPAENVGSNRQVISTPEGVWFFDTGWESRRWSR